MNAVAIIPARIGSTRFPRKMLATINHVPLIVRTYQNILATNLFTDVYVVTDSDDIEMIVKSAGGKVLRSIKEHECGTDRIAEVAENIDTDIIINVQGDEPFLDKKPLTKLLHLFNDHAVQSASLVEVLDSSLVTDPNKVKVVLDKDDYAIYFSRSPIPYLRNQEIKPTYYKHVGIYAFRKDTLLKFAACGTSTLENIEQLECNRFIENGMPIKMAVTDHKTIAVDTIEDIAVAESYLNNQAT